MKQQKEIKASKSQSQKRTSTLNVRDFPLIIISWC